MPPVTYVSPDTIWKRLAFRGFGSDANALRALADTLSPSVVPKFPDDENLSPATMVDPVTAHLRTPCKQLSFKRLLPLSPQSYALRGDHRLPPD
jgi:hypothetical protein